jgi:AcrR family transcriptional regulator
VAQPHLTHAPAEERLPATHTLRPDSDATRRAILAASANWFSRIGFERTTTRQIATSANVNQGLLYYYFKG